MEQEILKTISVLDKLRICKCCGGEVEIDTCSFCGKKYDTNAPALRLKNLLQESGITYDIYIGLLNLLSLKFLFIDMAVVQSRDFFKSYLEEKAARHDYGDIIKVLLQKNASILVDRNSMLFEMAKYFYQYGTDELDKYDFLSFIVLYTKSIMEASDFRDICGHRPRIKFATDAEMRKLVNDSQLVDQPTVGLCIQNDKGAPTIYLNTEIYTDLKSSSLINSIAAIYHELQHVAQRRYYTNPEDYNITGFLMAQDSILEKIFPSYYADNYEILPTEANANLIALVSVAKDLESLGLDSSELHNQIETYRDLTCNPIRHFRGKDVDVSAILDTFKIPSPLLTRYPILSLAYNVDGPYLVRKTKKEIEEALTSEKNENIKRILKYVLITLEQEKRI